MRSGVFLLLLGCTGPSGQGLRFVDGPTLSRPDDPDIHLARVLTAETSEPTRLTVQWGGRTYQTGVATTHTVPILGLRADASHTLEIRAEDLLGRVREKRVSFDTDPLPFDLPKMDVLAHDPAAMEPGYTLIHFHSKTGEPTDVVILDPELEPVWAWDTDDPIGEMHFADGLLSGISGGSAFQLDLLGGSRRRWTHQLEREGDILWDGTAFHYDFLQGESDFVSLANEVVQVGAYPVDEATPTVLSGPVDLRVPHVVRVGYDGILREKWSLADRLDTTRIGFNSLNWWDDDEAWDWAHANAVAPDPRGGGFLVSLRHQDAVIKLSATGDLQWILGNHDGWSEDLQPYLLDPVGDLQWQYHQHAPMVTGDGDIVLFDNGNNGHSPYEVPDVLDEAVYSRVAMFRVDPVAMEVSQVWEHRDTMSGPIFSGVMGDADWLPLTGNILGTFASVSREGEVENLDAGLGKNSIRLVEIHPDGGPPALDVRFYQDFEEVPRGVWCPRTERIPDLYAADGATAAPSSVW